MSRLMAVAKIAAVAAKTASAQVEIGGLETEEDEQAEIEAGYIWRELLWSAIRSFVGSYVDARTGAKGWDACAAALDRRWGVPGKGRGVSGSVLRAALTDGNHNHLRAEWLDWFAARDADIANLMARRVKPEKTAEERLADIEAELRDVLSHKQAEAVLRRARAR